MFADIVKVIRSLSKRELYIFLGALGIFIIAVVLVTVDVVSERTTLTPVQGGSYTEGVVGQPTAINPILATNAEADRDMLELLYSDLISLSQDYSVSEKGAVWNVILQDEIFWSDGKPITTNDVMFTLGAIKTQSVGSPLYSSWQGIEIERLSKREVQFTLKTPYVYFLDKLKSFKIAPAHVFEPIPLPNLRLSNFNFEPVSSGPYKFVSYEKEASGFITNYKLEANPLFHGDKALIENLTIRFYPGYDEAILAFNQKDISGLGGIDSQNLKDLKINHETHNLGIPRYYAIFFNPTVEPLLKTNYIRRVLTQATDKERVVKEIFGDYATISDGPISPYLPGYNSEIYKEETFSLTSAMETLESNGWTINSEGVQSKEDMILDFELIVPQIQFLIDTAKIIQEDWASIGIRLNLITVPVAQIQEEYLSSRNYQMLIFGNILQNNTDIYSFWHSSQRFEPGLNLSLYENKTIDNLLESTRKDFDVETQNKSLSRIQELIQADRPAIFLFSPNYLYASDKNLGGFDLDFISTPSKRLGKINSWFLKTSRVFKN